MAADEKRTGEVTPYPGPRAAPVRPTREEAEADPAEELIQQGQDKSRRVSERINAY